MRMNATAARATSTDSAHWYTKTGEAMYEVPRASGEGMRPTTLADARKLNLLPSVSTILKVIDKPQLTNWLVEQACLAVLTTPRLHAESLDQFVERVLHTERVQDQESDIAKKRGTEIHNALESVLKGDPFDPDIAPWIDPVIRVIQAMGTVAHTEHILVGEGYAGKCDLILTDLQKWEWVIDFKTTRRLPPKESYWEHQMQTAAYLKCRPDGVRHANIYISTVNQGEFVFHDNGDYLQAYEAFKALLSYWQIANRYAP